MDASRPTPGRARVWVISTRASALIISGHLDEADGLLDLAEGFAASADADARSHLAIFRGRLALARGQARTAAGHLREAVGRLEDRDLVGRRSWALSLLAEALAYLVESAEAEA